MSLTRKNRPVIGVTGPDRGGWPAWIFTRLAIWRAGGRAIRITPRRKPVTTLDGVVLGGGADVAPEHYGETLSDSDRPDIRAVSQSEGAYQASLALVLSPLLWGLRRLFSVPRHSGLDLDRDELELSILRYADAKQLPLLGICRGAQLMNVFAGGTLHQSLDKYIETPQAWTVLPQKEIEICQGTELQGLFGDRCRVNSLHRQAIARSGAELKISAYDSSKIVQGIERSSPYWLGVQWHPEYLPQSSAQQQLFRALVERSRNRPRSLQAATSPPADLRMKDRAKTPIQ